MELSWLLGLLLLVAVGLPWVSTWCAHLLLPWDMLASKHVLGLLKLKLVILFHPDLTNHARGGAKEHDVSNAINDL